MDKIDALEEKVAEWENVWREMGDALYDVVGMVTGRDDRMGYRLMRLFQELHRAGTTVVVATHNEALMARFPYPRLHLAGGELVAVAPPEPADG